jgi:uncharacterized protein YkwD
MSIRTLGLGLVSTLLAVSACAPSGTGGPASGPPPRPSAPPPTAPAPSTTVGEQVVARTNGARRAAGLAPLGTSAALVHAAELQTAQIVRVGTLAHDLPGTTYPSLAARLAAVHYAMRAAGENIGQGYSAPAEAVAAWMASSGHRANILSASYTEMGAATARARDGSLVWVQVFGAPR